MPERSPPPPTPDEPHALPLDGHKPGSLVRLELEAADIALVATALERLVESGGDRGVVAHARGLLAYVRLEQQKAQRAGRNGSL